MRICKTYFCLSIAFFMPFLISAQSSLTIISPNGGENWQTGTTQTIEWTSSGVGEIQVDCYNNEVYEMAIGILDAGTGSFEWAIRSDFTPGQYKIKIIDFDSGDTLDESDDYFNISSGEIPSITVTSPMSGDSWELNAYENITWTSTGLDGYHLKIELLKGGVYTRGIASGTENDGSFNWGIPADLAPGNDYSIRISDSDGGGVSADSQTFSLVTPPPAEVEITITYSPTGSATITPPEGTYTFNSGDAISISVVPAENYVLDRWYASSKMIEIENPFVLETTFKAYEDGEVYAIMKKRGISISRPEQGESYDVSSTMIISWTTVNLSPDFNIYCVKDDSDPDPYPITANYSSTTSYRWNIPENFLGGTYKIKIAWAQDESFYGISGAVTIEGTTPEITVISPGESSVWQVGGKYDIRWRSTGIDSNMKIELMNKGVSFSVLNAETDDSGIFEWQISDDLTPGSEWSVKISALDNSASGVSENFRITSGSAEDAYYDVKTPLAGSSLFIGTSSQVGWDAVNCSGTVSIQLFKDDSLVRTLAQGVDGQSWDFYIGDELEKGDGYSVRIENETDNGIYGVSGAFSIAGVCYDPVHFAYGSVTEIDAGEVSMDLDEFSKKINVTAEKGTKKYKLQTVTKVSKKSPAEKLYAAWNNKLPLYSKNDYDFKASLAQQLATKPVSGLKMDKLLVTAKEKSADVNVKNKAVYSDVTVMAPEITGISGNPQQAGNEFAVYGKYFGSKIPSIYVEYYQKDRKGLIKYGRKSCKIVKDKSSKFMNCAKIQGKSCMKVFDDDPADEAGNPVGYSEITVQYPKLPSSAEFEEGQRNIILNNGYALASYNIESGGGSASGTGSICGIIKDSGGLPVQDAEIAYGDQSTVTDSSGYFLLNGIPAGSRTISISKESYMPNYRVTEVLDGQTSPVEALLVPLGGTSTFNSSSSATVDLQMGTAIFPADSFVVSDDGVSNAQSGKFADNMNVTVKGGIVPAGSRYEYGSFPGLFLKDNFWLIEGFGYGYVSVKDENGKNLEAAYGKPWQINIPILSKYSDKAPESADVLYLDTKTGLWHKSYEGLATRSGNSYTVPINKSGYWLVARELGTGDIHPQVYIAAKFDEAYSSSASILGCPVFTFESDEKQFAVSCPGKIDPDYSFIRWSAEFVDKIPIGEKLKVRASLAILPQSSEEEKIIVAENDLTVENTVYTPDFPLDVLFFKLNEGFYYFRGTVIDKMTMQPIDNSALDNLRTHLELFNHLVDFKDPIDALMHPINSNGVFEFKVGEYQKGDNDSCIIVACIVDKESNETTSDFVSVNYPKLDGTVEVDIPFKAYMCKVDFEVDITLTNPGDMARVYLSMESEDGQDIYQNELLYEEFPNNGSKDPIKYSYLTTNNQDIKLTVTVKSMIFIGWEDKEEISFTSPGLGESLDIGTIALTPIPPEDK